MHPGDLAMIITPEQAALKAQHQFDALRDFVQQAARDGQRIDTVERELFRQLLGLGHTLLSAYVAAFQASSEVPPPAEEGPLLVVTADGKGVPMRRPPQDGPKPHHRRTKGEKANKKQMACVGAVYSIEPFVRKAEDIIDEVLRDQKAKQRPRPQHKHVWAEMSREIDGIEVPAKEGLFCQLYAESTLRNLGHDRPVICLLDGERALWDAQQVYFPEAVGILDLFHVLERLWAVAHCFHKEGSDEAKEFVEQRLRDLLQGRVGYVIGGLRRRLEAEKLSAQRRKV